MERSKVIGQFNLYIYSLESIAEPVSRTVCTLLSLELVSLLIILVLKAAIPVTASVGVAQGKVGCGRRPTAQTVGPSHTVVWRIHAQVITAT